MADKILMIDTGLLIDYFRKTDKSNAKLVQLSKRFEKLAISSVTEFEIYSGATPSQLTFWNELLSEIIVLPFDSKAAHIAAQVQQDLKKIRRTIEKADLFIAATAIANDLRLNTFNLKHFEKIKNLTLFVSSGG